jgi:hypothetical protein
VLQGYFREAQKAQRARAVLPGMIEPRSGRRTAEPTRARSGFVTSLPVAYDPPRSAGTPIHREIRQALEQVFDRDFSRVRIHEALAAQALGACAVTHGESIYFTPGLYAPATPQGLALLGHELTHVVQQREGRVINPYAYGFAIVQDPTLESEADQMGRQISEASWRAPRTRRVIGAPGAALPPPRDMRTLQRMEDSESSSTVSSWKKEGTVRITARSLFLGPRLEPVQNDGTDGKSHISANSYDNYHELKLASLLDERSSLDEMAVVAEMG